MHKFLNEWRRFEKRQASLLCEIKMEQVLPRFESKPFLKAYERWIDEKIQYRLEQYQEKYPDNSQDLSTDWMKGLLQRWREDAENSNKLPYIVHYLKGCVPRDISERHKAEALNWLITMFIKLPHYIVDKTHDLLDLLETFFQIKEQGLSHILAIKDINQIEDLTRLIIVVEKAEPEYKAFQEKQLYMDADAGTNLIYSDENWNVYIPENKGAACQLGKGTKWCTAGKGLNYYKEYHSAENPLIVFVSKQDPSEKYQFLYLGENEQYMDANNIRMPFDQTFYQLNGIVTELSDKLPQEVVERAKNQFGTYKDLGDGKYCVDAKEYQYWFMNGKKHRDDGPAVIYKHDDHRKWYIHGKFYGTTNGKDEKPPAEWEFAKYAQGLQEGRNVSQRRFKVAIVR